MMAWQPARVSTVFVVALSVGGIGWLGLDRWIESGWDLPPLPWTAVVGMICLAVAVLLAGLPVRRWKRGERDRVLDPLYAARIVVLAKAAAYGGAALTGWYASQALVVLPDVIGARAVHLALAVGGTAAAVSIVVSGFIVQRWCRVRSDDDDEKHGDSSS